MDAIIKSLSLKCLSLNDSIMDPNDIMLPLYQTITAMMITSLSYKIPIQIPNHCCFIVDM